MYAEELSAAYKSFTAVEADGEIFTGVILTRTGHILVPAVVTEARVIRAKIVDYLHATVVAVDATSGLAVVQVDGPKNLRPVVLGNVDNLREYKPDCNLHTRLSEYPQSTTGDSSAGSWTPYRAACHRHATRY